MKQDIVQEAVKAVPPVVVSAWTLNDTVMTATLAYIVLQALYLLWKWFKEWKRGRK